LDIRKKLWEEHSKSLCLEIVNYVGGDQIRFDLLFACVEEQKKTLSQRAAWPLSYCVENHPHLLEKHYLQLPEIISQAMHPSVRRNTMRALLWAQSIPDEISGYILDQSFKYLLSEKEPVAIRSLACKLIVQIGGPIPELRAEIEEVFADLANHDSPAVRSAVKHGLVEIKKWGK